MNIVSPRSENSKTNSEVRVEYDLGCGENILKNRGKWNEALKK